MADIAIHTATEFADDIYFGEGPRWHDGRFWVSDFYAHRVYSFAMDASREIEADLGDDQPSGLGWLPDGRMLISAMLSRRVLRREDDGSIVEHADLSSIATFHTNDMIVDSEGRAYVGNFGFDMEAFVEEWGQQALFDEPGPIPASLAMVQPDGSARSVSNGLKFPNGMVITPDGSTLILAVTMGLELLAYDIVADGRLTNRRTWAPLAGEASMIAPDGICLDADGGVWVADALGSGVVRVVEGGAITDRVETSQPAFACILGGPDRQHLLACTAPSAASDAANAARGKLEICEVPTAPGAGTP